MKKMRSAGWQVIVKGEQKQKINVQTRSLMRSGSVKYFENAIKKSSENVVFTGSITDRYNDHRSPECQLDTFQGV